MSKLATHLYTTNTQRRHADPRPLHALTVNQSWDSVGASPQTPLHALDEYRIGVRIEHRVLLSYDQVMSSKDAVLINAVAQARRAVIEEVFGEFREHFRAVEMALYTYDIDTARAALKAFETQMFTADTQE